MTGSGPQQSAEGWDMGLYRQCVRGWLDVLAPEPRPIECLRCGSRSDLVFSAAEDAFVCFSSDACDSSAKASPGLS